MKKTNLTKAQIETLVVLWNLSERAGRKFLEEIGIAVNEEDVMLKADYIRNFYIRNYLDKEEFILYSEKKCNSKHSVNRF